MKVIKKVYTSKATKVEALKEVNIHIKAGEIYRIIGYSGAGKSTLIVV
ncbi:ATP-binding cassette domain-containing protein [Clostridium thailandense]|nr:ATP-binding cassette domain-containing protein [Clostridium thailandense]